MQFPLAAVEENCLGTVVLLMGYRALLCVGDVGSLSLNFYCTLNWPSTRGPCICAFGDSLGLLCVFGGLPLNAQGPVSRAYSWGLWALSLHYNVGASHPTYVSCHAIHHSVSFPVKLWLWCRAALSKA